MVIDMKCGCRVIATLTLLLSLVLTPLLTSAEQMSITVVEDSSLEKRAETMLSLADKAKVRAEALLNSVLANETLMDIIRSEGLMSDLEAVNETFNMGVSILNLANETLHSGNYTGAISLAMESMRCFRDAYRELNIILHKIGVLEDEVIRGRGLLIAIQCALERIGKAEEIFKRMASKTGIDASGAIAKLEEAKETLNVTRAEELLRQGNISDVARTLAEANRLISEAFRELKSAIKEKIGEKIERFKDKLRGLREEVKERLRKMNLTEREFFKRWGFASAEGFWRNQIEILERVRERLRLKGEVNATGLEILGRRMREVRLEIEFRLRELKGGKDGIEVDLEKTVEFQDERGVTAVLRVTVRNTCNITVTFPNSAFGTIIERERDGRWEFYYSPISLQVLVSLEPGESGEVEIRLTTAEPGDYRIVVRALSREGLQTVATKYFELP